jgi:hypothetical protein
MRVHVVARLPQGIHGGVGVNVVVVLPVSG